MKLQSKDSRHCMFLIDNLFRARKHYIVDFQGFNIAMHEDQLEIGVAEEHNYFHYTGVWWQDTFTQRERERERERDVEVCGKCTWRVRK